MGRGGDGRGESGFMWGGERRVGEKGFMWGGEGGGEGVMWEGRGGERRERVHVGRGGEGGGERVHVGRGREGREWVHVGRGERVHVEGEGRGERGFMCTGYVFITVQE